MEQTHIVEKFSKMNKHKRIEITAQGNFLKYYIAYLMYIKL